MLNHFVVVGTLKLIKDNELHILVGQHLVVVNAELILEMVKNHIELGMIIGIRGEIQGGTELVALKITKLTLEEMNQKEVLLNDRPN